MGWHGIEWDWMPDQNNKMSSIEKRQKKQQQQEKEGVIGTNALVKIFSLASSRLRQSALLEAVMQ